MGQNSADKMKCTKKSKGVKKSVSCQPFDEGDPKEKGIFRCAKGKEIKVISATYGRSSETKCDAGNGRFEAWRYAVCANSWDATEQVREACEGKQKCTFKAPSVPKHGEGYSDPCVGTHKFLETKYVCQ